MLRMLRPLHPKGRRRSIDSDEHCCGSSATPTTPPPASGWSRPYLPTKKSTSGPAQPAEEDNHTVVMLRDAIFVLEKESGHGGGRGAARGWGYDSVSSDCA